MVEHSGAYTNHLFLESTENEAIASYRPYIDNFNLTEVQKMELVSAIRKIAEIILNKNFKIEEIKHKNGDEI